MNHSSEYIRLNAKILDPLSQALEERCISIPLSTRSAIKASVKQIGWIKTGDQILSCFFEKPDGVFYELAENNTQRKLIRFPALRYIGPAVFLYRRIKKMQCMLFAAEIDAVLHDHPNATALMFNGTMMPESILALIAKNRGHKRLFIENGYFPGTLQVDPLGINANNSLPRDPEFYQNYTPNADQPVPTLVGTRDAKVIYDKSRDLPERYFFVPFQVPSDMQVTHLSPWISSMEQFYAILYDAVDKYPDINFVIKEHPSYRRSVIGKVTPHANIHFANGHPTPELIANADAVVTLNSTVGIEALVLEKKVITLGLAAYNVEGLVLHCNGPDVFDKNLKAVRDWCPNELLRQRFLQYLYYEYLIPGTIKEPVPDTSDYLRMKLA